MSKPSNKIKYLVVSVLTVLSLGIASSTNVTADSVTNESCQTVYGVRNCNVSITPNTAISLNEVVMIAAVLFVVGLGAVIYSKQLRNQLELN